MLDSGCTLLKKFRVILIMNKSIVYMDHSALKYLLPKRCKARLQKSRLQREEKRYRADKQKQSQERQERGAAAEEQRSSRAAESEGEKRYLHRLENPHKDVDFMGPFHLQEKYKYILLAVDYLSNGWKPRRLPTNDVELYVKFLKLCFARFGTPRAIISDRGTYFCNDKFAKVMSKYRVTHRLAIAYHPQTSGQVEVSNRGLKCILERTVGENHASWSDKLDDALCGIFCNALQDTNWLYALQACLWKKLQLNELNELRDQAYENSLIYTDEDEEASDSKI
ncbi:reverse transcriptase domain-containing protein [Tanacetum coccineum]